MMKNFIKRISAAGDEGFGTVELAITASVVGVLAIITIPVVANVGSQVQDGLMSPVETIMSQEMAQLLLIAELDGDTISGHMNVDGDLKVTIGDEVNIVDVPDGYRVVINGSTSSPEDTSEATADSYGLWISPPSGGWYSGTSS